LNTWKITTAEKKFVLFLIKKNILNIVYWEVFSFVNYGK
jgi:hypothetical protein